MAVFYGKIQQAWNTPNFVIKRPMVDLTATIISYIYI